MYAPLSQTAHGIAQAWAVSLTHTFFGIEMEAAISAPIIPCYPTLSFHSQASISIYHEYRRYFLGISTKPPKSFLHIVDDVPEVSYQDLTATSHL